MKYSAFISYNHRDREWARWLHRGIETWRAPKALRGQEGRLGPVPDRFKPVFRDRDELAAGTDLAQAVQDALEVSENLIVICTPGSARSKWVNEEIRTFRRLGRGDRIFCLVADGEPLSDDPDKHCMPAALTEDGSPEPLAADARPQGDGKQAARVKILAAMLGVGYDDLRQREAARRIRQLTIFAGVASIAFIVTAALAIVAYLARNEAITQRDIARQRTVTAERTVDFVTAMFRDADPSEAQGADVTVRQVVDRASGRYGDQLADQPAVRGQIGLTLSEVYGALGLFQQSDRLVGEVGQLGLRGPLAESRQALLQGESDFRLGKYESAARLFSRAARISRTDPGARETVLSRALKGLGQSLGATDRFDESDKALREAMKIDRARGIAGQRDLAQGLEAYGLNRFFQGDFAAARPLIEEANALRMKTEGNMSPSVSDNLNTLASIAYFEGRGREAERMFLSRLAIDEKVLGEVHPDVAGTLNNIGRIRLERRDYKSAEPMLARAVRVAGSEKGREHDDMAFMLSNLALARQGLGNLSEAEKLLRDALAAAERHGHRTRGPIGTDLAGLLCRRGRIFEATTLLSAARASLRKDYPDDAWRLSLADNVRSECLWREGKRDKAVALFRESSGPVLKHWPRATHYGSDVDERAKRMNLL